MTEENKSVKKFPNSRNLGNAPKLRFEGFTLEWEETTLGNCSESIDYGMNASATKFDGENKYIRITDIDENSSKYKTEFPVSPSKDLMDRLKAKDNMFLQEVKTLKILTSDGKEEVLFQAYKTSKETGNKELYKINDYVIAKDITIPYGAVITTSQDNIEKYYHDDLKNAIKINKEYKDKKVQEKLNK